MIARRWFIPFAFAAMLALPFQAQAASVAKASVAKAPVKASSVKLVQQVATLLPVGVDHSVSVTLDSPAASVFIANPDVADIQVVSPTTVLVFGKKTGQTTLIATDAAGHNLLHKTVVVEQDLTDLRAALNAVIPDNKIKVNAVPNGIVLTGEAKDPGIVEDARRLALRYVPKDGEVLNRLKVKGSNQIQIRVRFAEVSRDVDKRFGIDWESMGKIGGMTFGLATGNTVYSTTNGVRSFTRTTTDSNTNDIIGMSYSKGNWDINGLIDALASDGFVTVLAEPNLTTTSGETASFLAGGEYPIPVPQGQNNVTITFKQYGVSLAFTPTLISGDRINMHVKPEVSQLTSEGAVTIDNITVMGLSTRRAETTVELGSGQSFAIAGLMNHNQKQSVDKYPFLGDLPILGELFRSSRFQNNETELVIIITPYIVKPATEEQLALPTDGFSPASDFEQLGKYRTTSSDSAARPISGTARAVYIDPNEAASLPAGGEPQPPKAAPVPSVSTAPDKKSTSSAANHQGLSGPSGFVLE